MRITRRRDAPRRVPRASANDAMRKVIQRTVALLALAAAMLMGGTAHAQADPTARLVLLGTKGGPAVRADNPLPSSNVLLIDGVPFVIDTGYGVSLRMIQAKVPLQSIRYVFITHHHSDHNLEYGGLLYNAWANGLKNRVDTYGPSGMLALDSAVWAANKFDIDTRIADEGRPDLRKLVIAHEYGEGTVLDTGPVKVTALRNKHPPIHDSFALKFEFGGKTVVFSGDTAYFPPLADFARNADYLVHEIMDAQGIERLVKRVPNNAQTLLDHLKASHTLAEDVGRIAADAGVKHLVLTHFVPADDTTIRDEDWIRSVRKHYAGPVIVGRDLLEIPLE
ncbi:MAG TPA: MBL fold metallo-hydrolase [Burkholderiaceae bacterium]|nr:MBL fold metallo-hydrolase [Burkholderiaceae bacterium]